MRPCRHGVNLEPVAEPTATIKMSVLRAVWQRLWLEMQKLAGGSTTGRTVGLAINLATVGAGQCRSATPPFASLIQHTTTRRIMLG